MSSTSTTSKKVRPSKVNLVCRTYLFPDYGYLKVVHFQKDPLLTSCTCSQNMYSSCSLVNQPVFFRIAHARAEGGGGRDGKNGLAKLARFLKSLGMFGGISHI